MSKKNSFEVEKDSYTVETTTSLERGKRYVACLVTIKQKVPYLKLVHSGEEVLRLFVQRKENEIRAAWVERCFFSLFAHMTDVLGEGFPAKRPYVMHGDGWGEVLSDHFNQFFDPEDGSGEALPASAFSEMLGMYIWVAE